MRVSNYVIFVSVINALQLMEAVVKGDLETVRAALAQNAKDKAAGSGGFDVNALVSAPHLSDGYRRTVTTALTKECKADEHARCEIARVLVAAGARPDIANSNGYCALHPSVTLPTEMMKIWLSAVPAPNVNVQGDEGTPLHVQALGGNADKCQILIEAKADVNAVNKAGDTALMVAVRRGRDAVVPVLLAAGADTSIKNNSGETVLTLAGGHGLVIVQQYIDQRKA